MKGDALARIVPLLRDAQKGGRGYMSFCPAHSDGSTSGERSLSVGQGYAGAVVQCFAGCKAEDVAACWGMTSRDLYDDSYDDKRSPSRVPSGSPDGKTQEKVTLRAIADRFRLSPEFLRSLGLRETGHMVEIPYRDETGKKDEIRRWRSSVASPGTKVLSPRRETMEKKGWRVVPYGLDQLPAIRASRRPMLLLVEGESDVWTLRWHQVPCLGIPGASATGCIEAEHVTGVAAIYLVREGDEAGHKFVADAAMRLAAVGWTGDLRVVDELPAKDVSDLHKADPVAFRPLLAEALQKAKPWADYATSEGISAPQVENVLDLVYSLDTRTRKDVEFLFFPHVPKATLTIIGAHPGAGKGFLSARAIAAITTGGRFLDAEVDKPGKVILLSAEDDVDEVIVARLQDAGADLSLVLNFNLKRHLFKFDTAGFAILRKLIEEVKPEAVVIDPLVAFFKEDVDMISQVSMRQVMQPLLDLATSTRVAILIVAHSRKGESPAHLADMLNGSIDIQAAPRSIILLLQDPDLAEGEEGGIVVHGKSNNARKAPPWRYRIVDMSSTDGRRHSRLEWTERLYKSNAQVQHDLTRGRHAKPELDEAVAILRRELESGPRSIKSIRSRLTAHGVAPGLIFSARAQVGAVIVELPEGPGWSLPSTDPRDDERRRAEVATAARVAGERGGVQGGLGFAREPGVDEEDETCPI